MFPDLKPEQQFTFLMAAVSAVSAISGALIAGLAGWVQAFIAKRAETRKHLRDIAVQLALEHWRYEQQRIAKLNVEIAANPDPIVRARPMAFSVPNISDIVREMAEVIDAIPRKRSLLDRLLRRNTPRTNQRNDASP
jgi:hypothetical protein